MWTRHEHHGGEYAGPAGALIRPEYRGPATGDRDKIRRAEQLRWPHDGGADDSLAFEVWASDRDVRAAGKAPPAGWFGIRCLTGKETEAREELEALGVEVIPLTYRTRTWPRKKRRSVIVERPLCPAYVFAFIQPAQWPQVRACNRVIGWIADDKGPLPVASAEQLHKLQNAAAAGAFDDTGIEGRLMPGDELEILFSPLSGWRVAFMALRGQMIEGELSMLGTARKAQIPASDIHMRKG
ncbi:transcription termination/antitermination NusG family protein [Pseudogemmobacter bohemicus]|uniref:transcription termination/antitermination NusG family protein n=1 Tax=Pseudogemmobacter bohemicus TaxID=2250708 RepID=UPI000DD49D37|nr:transcription termination/antitermination NusG family protein [Pseudogemmobacter bohemicus]